MTWLLIDGDIMTRLSLLICNDLTELYYAKTCLGWWRIYECYDLTFSWRISLLIPLSAYMSPSPDNKMTWGASAEEARAGKRPPEQRLIAYFFPFFVIRFLYIFLKIFIFESRAIFYYKQRWISDYFLKTFCLVHVEVQETYVSEDVRNGVWEAVGYRETY